MKIHYLKKKEYIVKAIKIKAQYEIQNDLLLKKIFTQTFKTRQYNFFMLR